jgi:hypothetical protein
LTDEFGLDKILVSKAQTEVGTTHAPVLREADSRPSEKLGSVDLMAGRFNQLTEQAATLGRAAREQDQKLDYEIVRAQCPRLAILAIDRDMREVLESDPDPKKTAAAMLSRVLHREESSIKPWAQGKK